MRAGRCRWRSRLAGGRLAVLVSACAALTLSACAAMATVSEMRILVTLLQPATDGAAIARDAEQAAGVPVRYLSAVGPLQHALALSCRAPAGCETALQALRAQQRFAEVTLDGRRVRH